LTALKLFRQHQKGIPYRAALNLREGDTFHTFDEWHSDAGARAYAEL
jgi:hypothetical protein